MITNSDLNISNEGYVKKDFYQVYPEIVELVQLLSTIWDPENTNESDPGVVLLKLDAFLTDKLNYNIDKNILEAFITSATQEDAVRKICEMMGYNIKYYNSATTKLYFMWTGDQLADESEIAPTTYITLPKFTTVVTNDTNDISYVLTEPVELTNRYVTKEATAIEGELIDLAINSNNIINVSNIDDNNRFYLPETQIAENGIWIYNSSDITKEWRKTYNLNTELKGQRVWKFGYDSRKGLPYIQFPDDYVDLFDEGIYIRYIRTSGASGNIKANILTKLVNSTINIYKKSSVDAAEENVDSTQYLTIKNLYATNNGCDVQTINEAYNGYKRTIGTFDTLTSCRDYSNAIYSMVVNEKLDNTPLVSNCQVSDIRNELNYAKTVAEYGTLGAIYKDVADETPTTAKVRVGTSGDFVDGEAMLPRINDFDLFVYPLNPIKNAYTQTTYDQSFKPLSTSSDDILFILKDRLDDYKTISHQLKHVKNEKKKTENPLYLYKNYYKLKAKIVTNNKVNKFEVAQIKDNVYQALYKNFNARELEYGEEIPYESLLNVMQNADSRIKMVLLDDPDISSFYMLQDGSEKELKYKGESSSETETLSENTKQYFNYVSKNVLAGKVPLFNYNDKINVAFNSLNANNDNIYGGENHYNTSANPAAGSTKLDVNTSITYISTSMELNVSGMSVDNPSKTITLGENETLQLISSKLINKETYPMYTNYFIVLDDTRGTDKIIAENTPFKLRPDEALYVNYTDTEKNVKWVKYCYEGGKYKKKTWTGTATTCIETEFSGILESNIALQDSDTKKESRLNPSWAKKNDGSWPSAFYMEGMFSLKPSEEIYIKGSNKAAIKKTAYIYWLANNNNTLTFIKNSNNIYECILNDGEYFFYTNNAKTDLLTLGPGTKLTYHPTSTETLPALIWSLNNEQSITKDDVAQNGIGAFANSDWIYKNWNDSNYLETEQMNVITLGYKDTINKIIMTNSETVIKSDTWYGLDYISYSQGETTYTETSYKGIVEWKVRPMLNINIGPNKYQELSTDNKHRIKLYTSWYADKSGALTRKLSDDEIKELLSTDPSKLVETIYTDKTIAEFNSMGSINNCLQSNINIQKSGGLFISVHTINITASNKDNVLIYSLLPATPHDKDGKVIDINKGINLTELQEKSSYAMLPLYIPDNNYDLFTFYLSVQTGTIKISICDKNGILSTYNILEEFNKIYDSGHSAYWELSGIAEGLHIIKINKPAPSSSIKQIYLKIEPQGGAMGELWILSEKLVDFTNESEDTKSLETPSRTGVNYNLLGFEAKACERFLKDYIIKKYPDFYATIDIDNSVLLDVDSMSDSMILFDKNNEVNKFVLAELNTDFSDIDVATSSKL